MTGPVINPATQNGAAQDAALHKLSQLVSGNQHIIDQPGLVQALYQGNATPTQASLIDQFVGGLDAEKRVRAASAGGNKIPLSEDDRTRLDAMGIPYQAVWETPQDAVSELKQKMAAQGVEPVTDANGNVVVDASGNPKFKAIEQPKHGGGWFSGVGSFFSHVGHGAMNVLNGAWNLTSGAFSDAAHEIATTTTAVGSIPTGVTPDGQAIYSRGAGGATAPEANAKINSVVNQNAQLMRSLGYNPSNPLDVLAFKAKGYEHSDTSGVASQWDAANPNGKFGWDGQQAVTQAELFAADPAKYRQQILDDKSLTDQEAAGRLTALGSQDFQDLVKRVGATRSNIGVDVANAVGLDPVKHSTAFTATSVGADLLASFFVDPFAAGLGAVRDARMAQTAVRSFADGTRIGQILDKTASTGVGAKRVQGLFDDLVDKGNKIRDAVGAGDTATAAALKATLDKTNPYAGLLPDVMGTNQLTRTLIDNSELERLRAGELPNHIAGGEPLDTYDKLVSYVVSKNALLRLQGGLAPIETSYMPGALSSLAFKRLRGSLTQWNVAASAGRALKREDEFLSWATDPSRISESFDKGIITRVLPQADDAVDVLKQNVLAEQRKVAAAEGQADQWGQIASDAHAKMRGALASGQRTGQWAKNWGDLQANAAQAKNAAKAAADDVASAREGLASAQRALDEHVSAGEEAGTYVTDVGRGDAAFNMRAYGKATPGRGVQFGNVVLAPGAFTLRAIAARARLAASRLTNQLPTDTRINLMDASSVDSIKKIALTYMTPGDANMLALRYALGDGGVRKSIVSGLQETVAHAAGLTRTKAGKDLLARWKATWGGEKYATDGKPVLDDNGMEVALHPGQVQEHFTLPNFGAVHAAAAKIGLFEATMGNVSNLPVIAHALGMWRTLILSTQVTAYRAAIEGWLNSSANGLFVDAAQSKALLRELNGLSGLAGRSRPVDKLASFGPLMQLGRFYRHTLVRQMTADDLREAQFYIDNLLQTNLAEQASSHAAAYIDPTGSLGVEEAAKQGLAAKQFKLDPSKAWTPELRNRTGFELTDELDGLAGAGKYADALRQRVNAAPAVAKAMIGRIRNPQEFSTADVVKALEDPKVKRLMDQTRFGKVYWDADGIQQTAATATERTLGKAQWADRMTSEFKSLVTARNTHPVKPIMDFIEKNGRAPDADWIHASISPEWRPKAVLAPTYEAVVDGGVRDFVNKLEDVTGRGYQLLVERFIQRHLTAPMHMAAYLDAKKGLAGYQAGLVAQGMSHEAAQKIVAEYANGVAWNRVARMVDDPRLKLQMDVVGRSFFAFSRATTMMLRRWGTTAWRNPAAARRMQLSAEAAVHAGLVQKDTNGSWTFSFPASGVAQEVLDHAMSHIPFFSGYASFPVADLTGNVTSIIPGSSQPFQYGTTPLVSLTGRKVADLFPHQREMFDEIDQLLNGSAGQGQGVVSTLLPTPARKIWQALDTNDRNSMLASSMNGSLYNLYATGQVPGADASPTEVDDFMRKLKTQTANNLIIRGVFGLFSPANLGNVGVAGPEADYPYQLTGAAGLRDEFKQLLNDTGGDFARSLSIWTYLHPDEIVANADGSVATQYAYSVFTQSTSQAMTSKALLPATKKALQWMQANSGFINRYKSVAAYFIPPAASEGAYSQAAYRAQLETGLRQRKTPQEFYEAARVATDADPYYAMKDKYDSDLQTALGEGNTAAAKAMKADWSAWSKSYRAAHPLFDRSLAAWSDKFSAAQGQLQDLHQMVKDGQVPGGLGPWVAGMLQAFDGYQQFASDHPGSTGLARAQRSAAFTQLQDYFNEVVTQQPGLTDLYNGVFRSLNSNLEDQTNGS